MNIKKLLVRSMTLMAIMAIGVASFNGLPLAHADEPATYGAPDQSNCDSGSTTYIWDTLNEGEPVVRPTIASLSVDGEEVPNPEVAAENHDIAVAICPSVEMGRRTGLFVYQKIDETNNSFDLTSAKTPSTDTVLDADSEITITIVDFGDLAQYFSFSLVHGNVLNYETTGLGTADATLTVTLKPVRTPYGNGEDFAFCTATPPNCNANASEVDAFAAALDITFDQTGYGEEFTGAYFAMTGAMGAWVEAVGEEGQPRSIRASLGGPHFLADGETLNTGSLQAFIPDASVLNMFEVSSEELTADSLDVVRTEGDESEDAPFDLSQVDGGILISMDDVTFSSPRYDIGLVGTLDIGGEGEEDSDTSKSLDLANGGFINLETPEGTVITNFTQNEESNLSSSDAGYSYPLGLANFTITVPSGSTQRITLSYLTDLEPEDVVARKFSAEGTYATIDNYEITKDTMDGDNILILSYDITDGGTLDQDGQVNGQIIDPVGLGVSSIGSPNTGL